MLAYRGASWGREMRAVIVLALVLLGTGCAGGRVVIRDPVEVTRNVYVRIDPALTEQCPVAKPRNDTVGELLRVARERRKALEVCNARMAKIRAIEGTPLP